MSEAAGLISSWMAKQAELKRLLVTTDDVPWRLPCESPEVPLAKVRFSTVTQHVLWVYTVTSCMCWRKALCHVGGLDISFYPAAPALDPELEPEAPQQYGTGGDSEAGLAASCSPPERGVAALVVLSYPVSTENASSRGIPYHHPHLDHTSRS